MELTEIQKKDFNKFSKVLNALNFEDGVTYNYSYSDEWDNMEGPYYKNKDVDRDIGFLPKTIEDFFENVKENFDTGNFYNDYYDSYNGSLYFTINAEKKLITIKYYYYSFNTEDSKIEKTFIQLSNQTSGFRQNEKVVKKLVDEEFLNEMKSVYGNWVRINYDGGGDSGYIEGPVESENGQSDLTEIMEEISYECLDLFHSGWENNEGSSGRMTFDFKNQKFDVFHGQNYENEEMEIYKTLSF